MQKKHLQRHRYILATSVDDKARLRPRLRPNNVIGPVVEAVLKQRGTFLDLDAGTSQLELIISYSDLL